MTWWGSHLDKNNHNERNFLIGLGSQKAGRFIVLEEASLQFKKAGSAFFCIFLQPWTNFRRTLETSLILF